MTARSASGWRVVYFGTPEVAVAPLQALCRAGHDVALVVTRPPKRRGRRQAPTPSPVEDAAEDLGLKVAYDVEDAVSVEASLGVVVAYGEYIPDEVLERRRTVNLHFSQLPRWRGAAPVERAILAGDTETGVCLIDVAAGDRHRGRVPAGVDRDRGRTRRPTSCGPGSASWASGCCWTPSPTGFGEPVPQTGEMTWADKIEPAELRVDWSEPAEHVLRLVRVGGAWTTYGGRRLKVLEARLSAGSGLPGTISLVPRSGGSAAVEIATGHGTIELVTVQSEGRAAAGARDWANGARLAGGEQFDR